MTTLLSVTSSMVTALNSSNGTYSALYDGDPNTYWFPGWQAASYPAVVLIDLQSVHTIEQLRIFDGTGQPVVKFSFAESLGNITHNISHVLAKYNEWSTIPVAKSARYIYVELLSAEGDKAIGGIEIFGVSVGGTGGGTGGGPVLPPTTTTVSPALTDVSLGFCVNSFHWIPDQVVKPFAIVREFNSWGWFEHQKGVYSFEPSFQSGANLDTHYANLKSIGVKPIFCAHQSAGWLNTYPTFDPDDKPLNTFTSDSTDPLSYSNYARFLFQVAGRYGSTAVPLSLMSVKDDSNMAWPPNQVKKSGLNLLEYISPWNEPDKWWKIPNGYFTAQEYAALLSACWDGHEGRILGGDAGIKTADPNMKVVLGGLVELSVPYIQEMDAWFKANRTDKVFCADVLDVHHYSNNFGRNLYMTGAQGISPEADNLRQQLIPLAQYRNQVFPNKELWLSEFGYDTSTGSVQRAVPYAGYNAEEVQAMWNVRAYMEAIAAGFDRTFIYHVNDINDDPLGIYMTSGLVGPETTNYAKKLGWNMVNDLVTKLKGLAFKGDQATTNDRRIFLFANADNSMRFAVVWAPTTNGTSIANANVLGQTVTITEMPKVVDLNAVVVVVPPNPNPPVSAPTRNVNIVVNDINVNHKVTHELKLATTDEVWVNGVKVASDVLVEIRRAAVTQNITAPENRPEPAVVPPPAITTAMRTKAASRKKKVILSE
jgi:hypothetical protein